MVGTARKSVVAKKARPTYYDEDQEARRVGDDLFVKLDVDSSGYLNETELARISGLLLACGDYGKSSSSQAIRDAMDQADSDKDGQVDALEWHKFFGSLYSVMGRKHFLSVARDFVATLGTRNDSEEGAPRISSQEVSERRTVNGNVASPATSTSVRRTVRQSKAENRSVRASQARNNTAPQAVAEMPSGPLSDSQVVEAEAPALLADGDVNNCASHTPGTDACPGEPDASPEDDEADRVAALRIQKSMRGNAARAELQKRRKTRDAQQATKEQKPSSMAEVWDMLTVVKGKVATTISVVDIRDLFELIKRNGLDDELREETDGRGVVPVSQVTAADIVHLGMLVSEGNEVVAEDAYCDIELSKAICEHCGGGDSSGRRCANDDVRLNFNMFRKLVSLVCVILGLEEQYILSSVAWVKCRVFEISDVLAFALVATCARAEGGGAGRPAQSLRSSVSPPNPYALVSSPVDDIFEGSDMAQMIWKGGIADPQGKSGIRNSDAQAVFRRAYGRIEDHLRQRDERRRRRAQAVTCKNDRGLVGRNQLEVLLELLHSAEPLKFKFASPLQMAVRMIRASREGDLAAKRT